MRHDMITISREYGAGASELASLLGPVLGWRVLDAEIPVAVATRLGIPDDALEEWDEHAPGFLESIGNSLMLGSPDLLIDPAFAGRPQSRDVAAATRRLLLEAAATPPLIVVGHGGRTRSICGSWRRSPAAAGGSLRAGRAPSERRWRSRRRSIAIACTT
jgi:hypothetical protein